MRCILSRYCAVYEASTGEDEATAWSQTGSGSSYLLETLNEIIDTSSTTRHVLSDPSTGYDSNTYDFGKKLP